MISSTDQKPVLFRTMHYEIFCILCYRINDVPTVTACFLETLVFALPIRYSLK